MYEAAGCMLFKCRQVGGASQGFLCKPAHMLPFNSPSTTAGRACLQRKSPHRLGNCGGDTVISAKGHNGFQELIFLPDPTLLTGGGKNVVC